MGKKKLAVVAIGGNSLIADETKKTIPDQYFAAKTTARYIVDMIEDGWNLVLTHGNGPQVGFVLRRSEIAIKELHPVPMDYAGADIQGAVGYMFQMAFQNEFRRRGLDKRAITIVTEVLVDSQDPAFSSPSKPIGFFMSESKAKHLAKQQGWHVKNDSDRGWRRVVPSPHPKEIIDLDAIKVMLKENFTVIACGGGGIPVIHDQEGNVAGVEAVIDKDLTSAMLAKEIRADLFLISTSVDRVALGFNTPEQKWLDTVTVDEANGYLSEGHFAEGSMKPKIVAIVDFLLSGGSRAIITNPPNLGKALQGKAGTQFIPVQK